MPYLINFDTGKTGILGGDAAKDLRQAVDHLSLLFIAALMGTRTLELDSKEACRLDTIIRRALPRIAVHTVPPFNSITVERSANPAGWDLSEVHRQLCQAAVLATALDEYAFFRDSAVHSISPSQQKGPDAKGVYGASTIWELEVYGGINIDNNGKYERDAFKLADSKYVKGGPQRLFFACWSDAGDPKELDWTHPTTGTSRRLKPVKVSPAIGAPPAAAGATAVRGIIVWEIT